MTLSEALDQIADLRAQLREAQAQLRETEARVVMWSEQAANESVHAAAERAKREEAERAHVESLLTASGSLTVERTRAERAEAELERHIEHGQDALRVTNDELNAVKDQRDVLAAALRELRSHFKGAPDEFLPAMAVRFIDDTLASMESKP